MSLPSFGKLLFTSALASGAIFSALTMPIVIFGSEPIVIQTKGESIFEGKLQDIAAPYLSVAGVLSLVAGVAGISVAGWRQSAQRHEEVEQQLLNLRQCLTEKETQIQGMLLSEKSLESSGLRFFLEDEMTAQSAPVLAGSQAPVVRLEEPVVKPASYPATPVAAHRRAPVPPQVTVQSAVSPLHAAHAFLSFTRSNSLVDQGNARAGAVQNQLAFEQIQDLQSQLKQVMSQIELLQNNLVVEVLVPASKVVGGYVTATLPHLDQRVQTLESEWVMRKVAS
jgi:type II secretory pathway pseudopilin PulG